MDLDTLQAQQTLLVRQRLTLMVNRYEVRALDAGGSAGPWSPSPSRSGWRSGSRSRSTPTRPARVLAGFKARSVIDLGATYDVTDGSGAPIGLFRKDFARSLLRSTWHVEQPGLGTMTGQERNVVVALLRRFADWTSGRTTSTSSATAPRPSPWPRSGGIRDTYVVTIDDDQLDRRLVIAMAVALDALQSR